MDSTSLLPCTEPTHRAPRLRERTVGRDLHLIRATSMREDFRRHTHQSVLVGLVTHGRRILETPQGRHDFGPGDGFAIPPGLVHWCAMPEAHSYRVALIAPEHWNALSPQQLTTLRGDWDLISRRIQELKRECSPIWLEVIYEGSEIMGDLQDRLRELTDGTSLEILRTRNSRPT